MSKDARVLELLEAGCPASVVESVIRLENAGHLYDWRTGLVIVGGASDRFELTPVGEATLHLMDVDRTSGL